MATVIVSAVFPAGAEVELVKRLSHEPHGGAVVATGVVREDSILVVEDLEVGPYWARVEGGPVVQVAAKNGVQLPPSVEERQAQAAAAQEGRPPAQEVIRGARTSTNARAKRAPKSRAVAAAKRKLAGKGRS